MQATTMMTNGLAARAIETASFVSRAMRSTSSRRRSGDCWVEADDGTRLYVRDVGAGRPVVLLHSWALSSQMWQYQVAELTGHGYRCITFDRRGHGRSDEPGRGYDLERLAGDLECVLDVLDLRDVTLVGHSFGCVEAVHYAAHEGRGRIARLALLSGTTPCLRKTADNPNGIDDVAFEFLRTLWRSDFAKWIDDNTAPFFTPETNELTIRWIGNMMLATPLDVAIAVNETMCAADVRADLRSLDVPVLIVHGDADASAPLALTGAATAGLVPHAAFHVYEGAPHGLFVTHKERLHADLVRFLEEA
jgi:pimeloyl-ACP methyl ester carboxylesterase